MTEFMQYATPILSAAFAAGGAYAAVRVELRHVWRKIHELNEEILRLRVKVPT